MTEYEQGVFDALETLKNEVRTRCDIVRSLQAVLRVQDSPRFQDNDMAGLLNAQFNIYQGLQISFENAVLKLVKAPRSGK